MTQTDNQQFLCELFRSCSYDPNQNKSKTFQTFFTVQRTIKKICKALKITLLQFLTKKA